MKRQMPIDPNEWQQLRSKLELLDDCFTLPETLSPDRMRYKLANLQPEKRHAAPRRLRAVAACAVTLVVAAGGALAWQSLQGANQLAGGATGASVAATAAADEVGGAAQEAAPQETAGDLTMAPSAGGTVRSQPSPDGQQESRQTAQPQQDGATPFAMTAESGGQQEQAAENRYAADEAQLQSAVQAAPQIGSPSLNRNSILPLTYSTPEVQAQVVSTEDAVELCFAPTTEPEKVYYTHSQDGCYLGSHMEDGVVYLATLAHSGQAGDSLPGYANSAQGEQLVAATDVVIPAVVTGAEYVLITAVRMGEESDYTVKAMLSAPQRLMFRQGLCTLYVADAQGDTPACEVNFLLDGTELILQ